MTSAPRSSSPVADTLAELKSLPAQVQVRLSHELVRLLSEQLYQSPLKAVEELVVNAYDAEATECRVFIPTPSISSFIIVYDNGNGMNSEGLSNLWHIGRSNKRSEDIAKQTQRKQIGKFGIGKLATYTIANRLTYISRSSEGILSVTVDFSSFEKSPTGLDVLLKVPVRIIESWEEFASDSEFGRVLEAISINARQLTARGNSHWTIAILEDLKDKARKLLIGDLRWVLRTAMPLKSDFKVSLNGESVSSSKEDYKPLVSFDLSKISQSRLDALSKKTEESWEVVGDKLVSSSFPSGVTGKVIVTERTLLGKSDDLARSHGFFVRVRDRLVNDSDALFGLTPLVHGTFNRFRADIQADDLDIVLKASREAIEESSIKTVFRSLLREIFNEANALYDDAIRPSSGKGKKEGDVITVPPRLVDHVIADVLFAEPDNTEESEGSEADNKWFYVNVPEGTDTTELTKRLYTEAQKYKYQYAQAGSSARLVQFDPSTATFWLNQDHELVQEYSNIPQAKMLLEDFATAEALLEVYLRESQLPARIIGVLLERRDALLRSLVRDHIYSSDVVARSLRESFNDEYRLEVSIVVAARTLGFVANHISGSGEPDGLARFHDYSGGTRTITLEAKSSGGTPSLGAIDFSGLREHMDNYKAQGCLLVAPSYPGGGTENENAVARRATTDKISCWTVELLAKFVEQAERKQLNAQHLLDIVLNKFTPADVERTVNQLLSEAKWSDHEIYALILRSLRVLEGKMTKQPRTIDKIITAINFSEPTFQDIEPDDIEGALVIMARVSGGGMVLRNKTLNIYISLEELERRLASLTRVPGDPRTISKFRSND